MVREIIIGTPCNISYLWDINMTGTSTLIFNSVKPSLYDGVLSDFCIYVLSCSNTTTTATFGTYAVTANGSDIDFVVNDTSSVLNIPYGTSHSVCSLTGQSVDVDIGDILGVCIQGPAYGAIFVVSTVFSGERYTYPHSCPTSGTAIYAGNNRSLLIQGSGEEVYSGGGGGGGGITIGAPSDICQSTGALIDEETHYNNMGRIKVKDFDVSGSPYQVLLERTAPWESSPTNDTFNEGEKNIYHNTTTIPDEYWSLECTDIYNGPTKTATFTECWWRVSDIYYVKKGGNDSHMGTSWSNAFATITKGADIVDIFGTLNIGYGKYISETDITPDNIGSDPINYYIQTPPSGSEWIEHTKYSNKYAYVDSRYPTINYGGTVYWESDNGTQYTRGYHGFDISDIRKDLVTNVIFKVKNMGPDNRTFVFFRIIESWDQGTITWNNRPNYDNSDSRTVVIDAGDWANINVTTMFETETTDVLSFFSLPYSSPFFSRGWMSTSDTELEIYYDNGVIITL